MNRRRALAESAARHDFSFEFIVAKEQPLADPDLASGMDQRLPFEVAEVFGQQDLDPTVQKL